MLVADIFLLLILALHLLKKHFSKAKKGGQLSGFAMAVYLFFLIGFFTLNILGLSGYLEVQNSGALESLDPHYLFIGGLAVDAIILVLLFSGRIKQNRTARIDEIPEKLWLIQAKKVDEKKLEEYGFKNHRMDWSAGFP